MYWAIDLLASEYGWSLTEILEHVYIDQLTRLVPVIAERKRDEYRIQLALIENPHKKDPKQLWKILAPPIDLNRPSKLDKTSFDIFKTKLTQGSHIVVK